METNESKFTSSSCQVNNVPCQICHLDLLTSPAYEAHENTLLHKKKKIIYDLLKSDQISIESVDLKSVLGGQVKIHSDIVYGEDHIFEFRLQPGVDVVHFWACDCCNSFGKTGRTLIDHLIGNSHRLLCIKRYATNSWPEFERITQQNVKRKGAMLNIPLNEFCAEKRKLRPFMNPKIVVLENNETNKNVFDDLGLFPDELHRFHYKIMPGNVVIPTKASIGTKNSGNIELISTDCGLLQYKCQNCWRKLVCPNSILNVPAFLDEHCKSVTHKHKVKYKVEFISKCFSDLECSVKDINLPENSNLVLHHVFEKREMDDDFGSLAIQLKCKLCDDSFSPSDCIGHLKSGKHIKRLLFWYKSEYMDTMGYLETQPEAQIKFMNLLVEEVIKENGRGAIKVVHEHIPKILSNLSMNGKQPHPHKSEAISVIAEILESNAVDVERSDSELMEIGLGHQFVAEILTDAGDAFKPTYICRLCHLWLSYDATVLHMASVSHNAMYLRKKPEYRDVAQKMRVARPRDVEGAMKCAIENIRSKEANMYSVKRLRYYISLDKLSKCFPKAVISKSETPTSTEETGPPETLSAEPISPESTTCLPSATVPLPHNGPAGVMGVQRVPPISPLGLVDTLRVPPISPLGGVGAQRVPPISPIGVVGAQRVPLLFPPFHRPPPFISNATSTSFLRPPPRINYPRFPLETPPRPTSANEAWDAECQLFLLKLQGKKCEEIDFKKKKNLDEKRKSESHSSRSSGKDKKIEEGRISESSGHKRRSTKQETDRNTKRKRYETSSSRHETSSSKHETSSSRHETSSSKSKTSTSKSKTSTSKAKTSTSKSKTSTSKTSPSISRTSTSRRKEDEYIEESDRYDNQGVQSLVQRLSDGCGQSSSNPPMPYKSSKASSLDDIIAQDEGVESLLAKLLHREHILQQECRLLLPALTPSPSEAYMESEVTNQRSEVRDQRSERTNQKSLVRDQRSEVTNQRSLVGDQGSEANNQRSEVRDQWSEVTNQKSLVRDQRSEVTNQRSLVGDQGSEANNQRSEVRDQWSEVTNQKSLVRDQRSEVTNQRSLVGDQGSEANNQRSKVRGLPPDDPIRHVVEYGHVTHPPSARDTRLSPPPDPQSNAPSMDFNLQTNIELANLLTQLLQSQNANAM